MKKRILIYMHYLEIGGAERALIGLLNALDPDKVDVELFLNQHTGEFMSLIPPHVKLLPQLPEYSAIERPISQIVREGHIGIAARRIIAKLQHRHYIKRQSAGSISVDNSIYQYVHRAVSGGLRDLSYLGEYDIAISYMHPHNIVLNKVRARRKVCWIHTDYSTVHINCAIEQPVWGGYDHIAAISDEAARAFGDTFPTLRSKLVTIENILSATSIRQQALLEDVSPEMPHRDGETALLSIGRYCAAKRFEQIPLICRRLLDRGLKIRWYIIGIGDDSETVRNIKRYDVTDNVILLGKRANPYPYIRACDLYVQPSLYEGKSVTVREAQILCRPVAVTDYPTAGSQVADGIDGAIVPLDLKGCAEGLYTYITDSDMRERIIHHLCTHDYGNQSEVNKIYQLMSDK